MKPIYKHIMFAAILLILVVSGFSCTYYPRLTSIPLIKEKGDTKIEGGVTVVAPSIQASVSHGVTDKIAIQIAATSLPVSGDYHSLRDYYLHGAIGYYKKMNERNVIEMYGGFAYGSGEYSGFVTGNYQQGNYQMYFTQFNFGSIKNDIEFGIGVKLGYMHTNMDISKELYEGSTHQNGLAHQKGVFAEPTGFVRVGGPRWKFQAALGVGRFFQIGDNIKIHQWPVNLGIGVGYRFGGISNK
jgi:hypothetical protein